MTETKNIAVLFDFDGVVVDTETQYSIFWHKMGVDYLGMEDLESRVKGQTLVYIYNTFFPGMIKEQEEITAGLDRFEQEMTFEFIPGVESFIADLRRNGVKMAVVTSSNDKKMEAVYRAKPEIKTMFDRILTAEMFTASKPAPDCFLLGMKVFGILPPNNLGARQKILTQAKGSFETAMENLALIDDAHDMSKSAATNNFLAFLECENDDFSKPIEEVWDEVNEQGGGECDGRFPFKFNRVR